MIGHRRIPIQTVHVLILTLLFIPLGMNPALAEDHLSSETACAGSCEISATPNYMVIAAQPAPLPDAPVPQRVIDKKFLAVVGALAGTETLRFTTHKLVLDHEHAAGAPWVTSVPANPHLVAKYAGIYAAEWLATYELKKSHPWLPGDKVIRKLWWAYPAAMMVIHSKNAVGSIRTQAPSGCPVAECGPQ
jgi:hypothetical protein